MGSRSVVKVALLGATGNLGQLLLQRLLAHGHRVSALVRSPDKLALADPALTVTRGDVRTAADVAGVVAGQDAVINAIGGEDDVRSAAIGNVIAAMQQFGIKRLINIGGAGILQVGPLYLYEMPVFPLALRKATLEHRRVFETLRTTDLDWTVICPPAMSADPGTGRFAVKADYPFLLASLAIAFADVAKFVVEELQHGVFVRQRVAISPA
jgi:putative NADH-flavin reductase